MQTLVPPSPLDQFACAGLQLQASTTDRALALHWLALDDQAPYASALNAAIRQGVQVAHLAKVIHVTEEVGVRLLVKPQHLDDMLGPSLLGQSHIASAIGVLAHTGAQLLVMCTQDADAVHVWCVPRLAMGNSGKLAVEMDHALATTRCSWPVSSSAADLNADLLSAIGHSTRLLWLLQCMRAQRAVTWSPELLGALLQCEALVGGDGVAHNAPLRALMAQAWLSLMQCDAAFTSQAIAAIQAWSLQTRSIADPLWRARAATLMAQAHLLKGVRGQDVPSLLVCADTLMHTCIAALRVRDRLAWGLLHLYCAQSFEALWRLRCAHDGADFGHVMAGSDDDLLGGAPALETQQILHLHSTASLTWLRQCVSGYAHVVRMFPATSATGLLARLSHGRTTQLLGRAVADQGVLMLAARILDNLQVKPPPPERHVVASYVAAQVPALMGETLSVVAALRCDKVQMVLAAQHFEAALQAPIDNAFDGSFLGLDTDQSGAHHGLGNALLWLAQHGGNSQAQQSKFQHSVEAFMQALTKRSLAFSAVDWSHTQAALGRAHALWSRAQPVKRPQQRGQLDAQQRFNHSTKHLEQSIACYGLALSAPHTMGWAHAQANRLAVTNGFVRVQLLAELGGVWLELGTRTRNSESVQAGIDCMQQALSRVALPNNSLRVLLHNNVAAAYQQLSMLTGHIEPYQQASDHYAQALSLLQSARAPVRKWLPVVSNWTNTALGALLHERSGLVCAVLWPGATAGDEGLRATRSVSSHTDEQHAVYETLQVLANQLTQALLELHQVSEVSDRPATLDGLPVRDEVFATWQLARVQAGAALWVAPDQAGAALAKALASADKVGAQVRQAPELLPGVSLQQLALWRAQLWVAQALSASNPGQATSGGHAPHNHAYQPTLASALLVFEQVATPSAHVWAALTRRVLLALSCLGQALEVPPSVSPLVGAQDELTSTLHALWQVDSDAATHLERLVTYADSVLQRWHTATD
jgi:tetratricopeptide (TPR) repeat protein